MHVTFVHVCQAIIWVTSAGANLPGSCSNPSFLLSSQSNSAAFRYLQQREAMRNVWQHFFFSFKSHTRCNPCRGWVSRPPHKLSITLILTRNHKAGFESSLGLPAISDAYQVCFGFTKSVLCQPKQALSCFEEMRRGQEGYASLKWIDFWKEINVSLWNGKRHFHYQIF